METVRVRTTGCAALEQHFTPMGLAMHVAGICAAFNATAFASLHEITNGGVVEQVGNITFAYPYKQEQETWVFDGSRAVMDALAEQLKACKPTRGRVLCTDLRSAYKGGQ